MSTPANPDYSPYNIAHWSDGYIDVDNKGDVLIRPHRSNDAACINLRELVAELQQRYIHLPVLVRFSEILHDRVNTLCNAFNEVAKEQEYEGRYTVVYPIKVNQQRRVVEEIVRAQPAANNQQIGLEAGSKPELLAVLAMSRQAGSVIICNGYKDREYIRLAMIGRKLGQKVYIVVEKESELDMILEESERLGVKPLIGIRARLATVGKGNWQNTGGEKSKFGLSAQQILAVVERLRTAGHIDTLQLLHFHLGSQIANIRDIQTGLQECAHFYTELRELGAPVDTLDIGGGLGVDYEGTRSRSACSVNYSIKEYAYNVVHVIQDECDRTNNPHPNIISESGRALTAHHAVLITNVIDMESRESRIKPKAPNDDAHRAVRDLWDDYEQLLSSQRSRSLLELYHDVVHSMSTIQTLFAHGSLSLQERSQGEQIYEACCHVVRAQINSDNRLHREVSDELNEKLADKLFVNFSLFQSLPDVWGIDQIFPILPISGLNAPMTRRVVIQDITCDSDGRVDMYVDAHGIGATLPLPEFDDKELVLGFFMIGAYQEILGDMHNLFGDTNSVDVTTQADGSYRIENPIFGDTVEKVLRYVNYEPERLLESFREQMGRSTLAEREKRQLLSELEQGLHGYTYLED